MDAISSWWVDVYIWCLWISLWVLLYLHRREVKYERIWHLFLLKTMGTLFIAWLVADIDSHSPLVPFYADWFWTTPFTLIIMWTLAHADFSKATHQTIKLPLRLIASNVLMLIFGMMAERANGLLSTMMFTAAGIMLGYILYTIWRHLLEQSQKQARPVYRTFVALALLVTVGWLYFPIIWLLGPFATGWLSAPAMVDALALGQVFVKAGLLILAVWQLSGGERR